jgi:hypothetical protein
LQGLYNLPILVNIAFNILKMSVVYREYYRRQEEFADCSKSTIQDSYTIVQIPQVYNMVWSLEVSSKRAVEQVLKTKVDFLFGNLMFFCLSNRLLIELPDLFSVDLLQEGINSLGWAFVIVIDQGKYTFFIFIVTNRL